MLRFVTPHLRLNSVLELQAEHLQALGLSGLLLDVDCTLKDHGVDRIGDEVVDWVKRLCQSGFRLCLLSNGKARRIGAVAEQLGVPFVAAAFKPLPRGCHAGLKLLELNPTQTAMVGDQIFADVLAGRLAGLFTILVRPTSPVEPWFTRTKRPFERQLLRWVKTPVGLSQVAPVANTINGDR
jgi:HAD superfamily phosphatase (TIGR01668 family)